eukprot:COSAG01_NODE_18390_length_1079_cov_0.943878_2_plen_215_part_01
MGAVHRSMAGAPLVFASTGNTTFLYVQLLNSSGPWLDLCPLPQWSQVLKPQCPLGQPPLENQFPPGAPGVSPVRMTNVSALGWQPPMPAATAVALLESLVVSDGVLLTVSGRPPADANARAALFLKLYAALLPLLVPPFEQQQSAQADDWDALATRTEGDLRLDESEVNISGHKLLRAYYNDSRHTTAESLTQFDVLEALRRWNSSTKLHQNAST